MQGASYRRPAVRRLVVEGPLNLSPSIVHFTGPANFSYCMRKRPNLVLIQWLELLCGTQRFTARTEDIRFEVQIQQTYKATSCLPTWMSRRVPVNNCRPNTPILNSTGRRLSFPNLSVICPRRVRQHFPVRRSPQRTNGSCRFPSVDPSTPRR